MKLFTGATKNSATLTTGVSVLLLQILSILQVPSQIDATVLSNLPACEDGCHCLGSNGTCPELPTITEGMISSYRAMIHTNALDVFCDFTLSLQCVPSLEQGEACAVELIPPSESTGSSCPDDFSYQ